MVRTNTLVDFQKDNRVDDRTKCNTLVIFRVRIEIKGNKNHLEMNQYMNNWDNMGFGV